MLRGAAVLALLLVSSSMSACSQTDGCTPENCRAMTQCGFGLPDDPAADCARQANASSISQGAIEASCVATCQRKGAGQFVACTGSYTCTRPNSEVNFDLQDRCPPNPDPYAIVSDCGNPDWLRCESEYPNCVKACGQLFGACIDCANKCVLARDACRVEACKQ
jgi:hypothetical protein